jgi:nucleotide-binding universal stress UspA family protein
LRLLESESVAIIHGFESPHRGELYASGFDLYASKRNIEEWELAARRRLLQNLEAAGVASDHLRLVFVQSRPVRQIQKEVRKEGPELLVLATKQHSTLDRAMRANVGNDALRDNECDIMIAPMP